jgi:anthranilate/para-aminobenzoate synthase component II
MPSVTAETSDQAVVLEPGPSQPGASDRSSTVLYALATIAAAVLLVVTVAVLW